MSTILYAALTKRRQESGTLQTQTNEPPGLKTILDGVAAIVPAEVLTAHAYLITLVSRTITNDDGQAVTTITDPGGGRLIFFALLISAAVLYAITHELHKLTKLDYFRMLIPAAAFISWTMLQKATAFDAVMPALATTQRMILATILGILLITIAKKLADAADDDDKL